MKVPVQPSRRGDSVAFPIEALESRIAPATFIVDTVLDTVATDGFVSLREAIVAANTNNSFGDAPAGDATGDVIFFSASAFATDPTVTLIGGELSITDDLQIVGRFNAGGPVLNIVIDAAGSSRIFNIGTTEDVGLADILLTRGDSGAGNSGGAIFIDGGNVTLTDVTIDKSNAAVSGGAIYQQGGVLTINDAGGSIDAALMNNFAMGATVDDGGGAIFNQGGVLNLSGVRIEGNGAATGLGNGGGIMVVNGTLSTLGGVIKGNGAARAGGGIELAGGSHIITLTEFDGNVAGVNGGGIHLSGMALASVNDATLKDNTASQEGGGLWNSSTGTLNISNTKVMLNTASGNAVEQGGGGIFNDGGTVTIVNSTIEANSYTATAVNNGGGGIFNDGMMTISNSTIHLNVATSGSANGGGILNSDGGTLHVFGGFIVNNQAARAGGGIENNAGTVRLTNVDLSGNSTGINGGGLHTSGAGMVTVTGGKVRSNNAGQEGGGLWNSSTGTMTIRPSALGGTEISDNVASGDAAEQGGGGIFNDGGNVTIRGAKIVSNDSLATAVGNGGGGIFNDGTMDISDSTVSFNTAATGAANGGGILNSNGGILTITNTTITGNQAARAGGGIENNAGTVNIVSSTLGGDEDTEENFAGINGGGLHTSGSGVVSINSSTVSGNEAGNEGGGLWNSNTGSMTVSDTTVSNNLAVFGGGIFGDGAGGTLVVDFSTVSGNVASSTGGGISIEGGTLEITNSTVSSNHSVSTFGGGIFILSGTVDVSNSTIAANTGEGFSGAGGLHISSGTVTLISTLVADNKLSDEKSDVVRSGGTLNSGFSLIESSPVGTINGTDENNLLDVDPQLGPLEDNGGSTMTHAIFTGSPAINAGSDPLQLGTDQRGEGFKRTVGVGADIGAFEQQRNVPINSIYAAASGKTDQVKVFDAGTGNLLFEFDAFLGNKAIKKGVTVATGDLDGDGQEEVIVGAGASKLGPEVRVFDGTNGNQIRNFLAYDQSFRGGVFVAVGDVNGDGLADIITGAGPGGGPHVKVFDGGGSTADIASFFAYDLGFKGGVRVAAGDVNGDGKADIITAPGKGSGPLVRVFSGDSGAQLSSFFAFPQNLKNGVFVAAGDVNGDGRAEVITSLDKGKFGNEVRVYGGTFFGAPRVELQQFFAFTGFTGGVRVATADIDLDGIADIITSTGSAKAPTVSVFNGNTGEQSRDFTAFEAVFKGGVFVG